MLPNQLDFCFDFGIQGLTVLDPSLFVHVIMDSSTPVRSVSGDSFWEKSINRVCSWCVVYILTKLSSTPTQGGRDHNLIHIVVK